MFRLIFVTVFVSLRIRTVSVFDNIRFRFHIRVSDSDSDSRKKNVKMNMIELVSDCIRSVFIRSFKLARALGCVPRLVPRLVAVFR